ncbi:MAG: iron ABC transporter substrate-binding protein [Anaerolineae bacterium]
MCWKHRLVVTLLIVQTALILAACGPAGNASSADENKLIIYSGRSESLVGPLIDQFAEATSIETEVRYGGTAELAATLLEEGANSPADLFYAQDPGGLGALQDAGLLAQLPPELLSEVPARFAAANREWVGISGRARVIVYNTKTLTPDDLPDDLWSFTEPKWKGRVGWAPTNGSFQSMITGMRALWGEERTRDWLTAIQANEPAVYEKNTPIVAAVAAGEVDAGFVNHYYLYRFIAEEGEGFTARNYFLPGGGPGSLLMISGVGVLKTAPHADNALKFIEFLLSEPGQQYFATETYEYPIIPGVAISPLLPPLAELDAKAADIAPEELADLEGTVTLLSELGILP